MEQNKLQTITNLFENSTIRSIWDSEKEEYYFSDVDVVGALTDSSNPRKYWSVLKIRLKKEGSEVTTNCSQLKMLAPNGKIRLRDAMLTNEIYKGWSGMKANEYKAYKGLRKESLRDNMTDIEIALTNIGEIAVRDIAKAEKSQGLSENINVAKRGGRVAKGARDLYEEETRKSAVSKENTLNYKYIDEINEIENK